MSFGLRGAVPVLAGVGAWAGLVDGGLVHHRAIAGPSATALALVHGLADGTLGADVSATGLRVLVGVALGAAFGLPVGLWLGGHRTRRQLLEPGLDFLRAVPPLLIFPLLLLAFGYGDTARIGAIAWAAALVVALHVSAGLAHTGATRARALQAMGASRLQRLLWCDLFEVLPHVTTALRHAVGTGLVVGVVTEMVVGAPHGLGARAMSAQVAYDVPQLYAVVLLTGLLGFSAARVLLVTERHLLFWCRQPS